MKKLILLLSTVFLLWGASAAMAQPTVSSSDPRPDKQDVGVEENIHIYFSEEMDGSTITNQSIRMYNENLDEGVDGTVGYVSDGFRATFYPEKDMDYSTTYVVTIYTNVRSLTGTPMANEYSFSFKTVDIWGNSSGSGGSSGACFLNMASPH